MIQFLQVEGNSNLGFFVLNYKTLSIKIHELQHIEL